MIILQHLSEDIIKLHFILFALKDNIKSSYIEFLLIQSLHGMDLRQYFLKSTIPWRRQSRYEMPLISFIKYSENPSKNI